MFKMHLNAITKKLLRYFHNFCQIPKWNCTAVKICSKKSTTIKIILVVKYYFFFLSKDTNSLHVELLLWSWVGFSVNMLPQLTLKLETSARCAPLCIQLTSPWRRTKGKVWRRDQVQSISVQLHGVEMLCSCEGELKIQSYWLEWVLACSCISHFTLKCCRITYTHVHTKQSGIL